MQKLLRLCLWQVVIFGILSMHFPVNAEDDRGIRMRGPKSSDVFPYDRYGPINSRDTLWNIALTIRPDNRLSVYQVMEALHQANPQAFVDSNINHLVEGQYLKIPSFDRMMAVNTEQARAKVESDEKSWAKKQPKVAKEPVVVAPSVKKEDLDTVKVEINDQLQQIDSEQQKRLATIQNDVLDSIDGLQAILKENEALRQRLTTFNDKLVVMQNEVAKSKEIKLQMDDMIQLQQALLAKAEAREQQLLLEKQQAEIAEEDFTSSIWFLLLMGTVPAMLLLGLLAFLFKRRQKASDEVFFNELDKEKAPKEAPENKKETTDDELSLVGDLDLDDELSLDDELDIEDELSLDDDLGLDLDDSLSLDDQLLDDDLSVDLLEDDGEKLLDDDVIHLDDDDDDALDDLEDILLDDDSDGEALEGGELGQGDLDDLLSGLGSDDESTEAEDLPDGELNQNDLDDLLNGLGDDDDTETNTEEINIDEELAQASADVTEPDDIDTLLESVDEEPAPAADVTDPDDIDA
ncbi:hypothetical protein KO495_03455, partial [Colwellia sp. D2M02]|uniref:FimV/HubP family polar landmark protein n=1 Tax=Colwellia sp. D2M02 TaxID=2841562 RepID=UPI0025AF2CC3